MHVYMMLPTELLYLRSGSMFDVCVCVCMCMCMCICVIMQVYMMLPTELLYLRLSMFDVCVYV
jgi:hypothetical protein